ncbi:MAG: choice-of-anchor D domain-containing protein [Bdellovibrionota bacterium]
MLGSCYSENSSSTLIDIPDTSSNIAVLSVEGSSTVNFGTVTPNASADQTITIKNSGYYTATEIGESSTEALSAPFLFKGGTFPGTGGTCTSRLDKDATCTVVVSFSPTEASSHEATLSISYIDGVTRTTLRITLTGLSS